MEILKWIYDAIDQVNEDLDQSGQILKSVDAQIFGNESALDSMGLVNLITLIEQRIEDETGKFISIADEKAMSMESSPFKTVASLKEYITNVLNE
jgi:acyl carrier protein